MKRIFKYQLEKTDLQIVEMPKGADILCVQLQHGIPCIWALVDENQEKENRYIETFGTGHYIGSVNNRKYISTIQFYHGNLVFHYFERLVN